MILLSILTLIAIVGTFASLAKDKGTLTLIFFTFFCVFGTALIFFLL